MIDELFLKVTRTAEMVSRVVAKHQWSSRESALAAHQVTRDVFTGLAELRTCLKEGTLSDELVEGLLADALQQLYRLEADVWLKNLEGHGIRPTVGAWGET